MDAPTPATSVPAAAAKRPAGRRILKLVVQMTLLLAVLVFLGKALWKGFSQAGDLWQDLHINWPMAALSALMVALNMVFVASAYRATLAIAAKPPRWRVMLGATWLSRVGKYLPGKVLSVAGLAYFLGRYGVRRAVSAGMVLVNTALAVIVGFIVAAPLLATTPALNEKVPLAWVWALVLVSTGLVCVHPRVCIPLINWLLRKFKKAPLEVRPRFRDYLPTCIHLLLGWITMGVGLWCLCQSLVGNLDETIQRRLDLTPQLLVTMVSLSALAMTLGFVALFAPGGIGVREVVYVTVLGLLLGSDVRSAAVVSLVTVATRVIHTALEGLLALVGLGLLKLTPPQGAPATDAALPAESPTQAIDASETQP